MPARRTILILAAIVITGAFLRLAEPLTSPPGMNVDEAGVLWNSWCLLQTGVDQHGVSWPIFRIRTFGEIDNRSTLYNYWLIPFLAVGGFSLETGRVAAAVSGVLTILLVYFIAGRLFGRSTAIAAAGLMAFLPWHIQQTRWSHDGAFQPFLVALAAAALLWADFPFVDRCERRPVPWRGFLAGLITGICCYGYQSARLFIPVFFTAAVITNAKGWIALMKSRRGPAAIAALSIGVAITFGPLVWKHMTDPEMNARGRVTWAYSPSDSLGDKAGKVLGRYLPHFGATFLFERGDQNKYLEGPAGHGVLLWYHLVLLLGGAGALLAAWRKSASSRFALLWLALYPIGDMLTGHPGPHVMRSQPGMVGIVLVCAVGAVVPLGWLWRRDRVAGLVLGSTLAAAGVVMTGLYLKDLYGSYNLQPGIRQVNQVDLLRALDWVRENGASYDHIFITSSGTPHPYIYTMVQTRFSPKDWLEAEKIVRVGPAENGAHPFEDVYYRVGRYWFVYGRDANQELGRLAANGRDDRVLFIVRPGEATGDPSTGKVLQQYRTPAGQVAIQLIDVTM